MDDLISRQAAIDALGAEPEVWINDDDYAMGANNQWHYDVNALKAVLSAEPTYNDGDIQKMQDLEQAQLEKAYQLGYEEGKKDAQPEERTGKRTETHACDCISRQMLLEYIHGEPVGRLLCDKYNLDGLIEQFPSAQTEQEAIEAWNRREGGHQ